MTARPPPFCPGRAGGERGDRLLLSPRNVDIIQFMRTIIFYLTLAAALTLSAACGSSEPTKTSAGNAPPAGPRGTAQTSNAAEGPPVATSHGAPPAAQSSGADTAALDAKIEQAEAKAKASGATAADKKAAAAAYLERANVFYAAGHPSLYKFALRDFRRTMQASTRRTRKRAPRSNRSKTSISQWDDPSRNWVTSPEDLSRETFGNLTNSSFRGQLCAPLFFTPSLLSVSHSRSAQTGWSTAPHRNSSKAGRSSSSRAWLKESMTKLETELVGQVRRGRSARGSAAASSRSRASGAPRTATLRPSKSSCAPTSPATRDARHACSSASSSSSSRSTATCTRSAATSASSPIWTSGAILPFDEIFAGYDPSAHVNDDFFENKLAFVVLLNFPLTTLEQRLTEGEKWSRRQWAEARLAQRFSKRIPAEVNLAIAQASAEADRYIAEYNIWMHHLVDDKGERLFPAKMRLLSHWNLRDEIKADYSADEARACRSSA